MSGVEYGGPVMSAAVVTEKFMLKADSELPTVSRVQLSEEQQKDSRRMRLSVQCTEQSWRVIGRIGRYGVSLEDVTCFDEKFFEVGCT